MDSVAETMMAFVVTLAAASYGHFGVTLKDDPALHSQHTQRAHQQPVVRRIPAHLAALPASPCFDEITVAERTAGARKA